LIYLCIGGTLSFERLGCRMSKGLVPVDAPEPSEPKLAHEERGDRHPAINMPLAVNRKGGKADSWHLDGQDCYATNQWQAGQSCLLVNQTKRVVWGSARRDRLRAQPLSRALSHTTLFV
jgi:hypothetical protein